LRRSQQSMRNVNVRNILLSRTRHALIFNRFRPRVAVGSNDRATITPPITTIPVVTNRSEGEVFCLRRALSRAISCSRTHDLFHVRLFLRNRFTSKRRCVSARWPPPSPRVLARVRTHFSLHTSKPRRYTVVRSRTRTQWTSGLTRTCCTTRRLREYRAVVLNVPHGGNHSHRATIYMRAYAHAATMVRAKLTGA